MVSMYNPKREAEILKFWKENKIFEKSLEQSKKMSEEKGEKPFVFFDGPPFATGLPHFGHVLPTTLKDIIPRYKTMQGSYVPRKWGWDCHGLPIENLVEKKLGLKNKKDIETYGVEKFNIEARKSVFYYRDEWKNLIPRLGRWIDMEHDYKTMDPSYTEKVWWSFKTLHEKNLAYEGYKVMPFCPRCGTTLSNFELNQPGAYKDITDLSAYVKFELIPSKEGDEALYLIAWTTTPWTLPGNVALAVNSEVEYVKIKTQGIFAIVAKERLEALDKIIAPYDIVETFSGKELVGKSYKTVFDVYAKEGKVYGADFVTTTDGTGIVHIAPAFGEDDLNLGNKERLPFIQHVGTDGAFKEEMGEYAGLMVKPKNGDDEKDGWQKTDIEMIKYLAKNNFLFAKEKFIHPYPHCWRCDTPLLNYATSSWFIKVTAIRDRLVEENKKIGWTPEHVGVGRFGKWLEGARDWGISRSRYWGAPLPIWQSEDKSETEIVGSINELKTKLKRNNYVALRHGEGEHNVSGIMSSLKTNLHHLTEKGREDILKRAGELRGKNIDVIIASPFLRTTETAEIIKDHLGLDAEIIFDERIQEENVGDFEAKTVVEYSAFFADVKETPERISRHSPNGESLVDVHKRVMEFMYEIDQKYENKNILIVSHYGVIKMLIESARLGNTLLSNWNFDFMLDPGMCIPFDFSALPRNETGEIDLHRPYIDALSWKSESGKVMKRIPEVFDTWYDSGSMPYASREYSGPADFISEGTDQTRGWFYSLLVLGVGLFDESPYKNVVVNGLILAEDGRKMSKSLKNYPDLSPTIDQYGADSLRYFLASSPAVKAEDALFSEKGLDEVIKKHFNRLYNILSLYEMYEDKHISFEEDSSNNVLDVWIKTLLQETINQMCEHLDRYEFDKATKLIGDFIEELSTWYIRRSRDRFKSDDQEEKQKAIGTTRFVLKEFSKLMAPFIPFIAEDIYLKLRRENDPESVHLCSFAEARPLQIKEAEFLQKMREVRKVITLGLELRAKAGIKVRQPLLRLELKHDTCGVADSEEYLGLIKDEVNVKEVIFNASINDPAFLDINVTEELQKEGMVRELIRAIQEERKNKNLEPSDKITIKLSGNFKINHLAHEYMPMIRKIASVEHILFEERGEEFGVEIV